MKRICIVGSGAAGLLLLLNFEKNGIDPSCITIVDPTHSGGDLMNKWSNVRSNTTWRQIIEAIPSRNSFAQPWTTLQAEEPVELKLVLQYLQACTKSYMMQTSIRTDRVVSVQQESNQWIVGLHRSKQPIVCDLLFLCQGSEPKSLDLPFPSIPLEIALDKQRLSDSVKPGDNILVFGTAHSGPLVVQNLLEKGAIVTNFYATEQPFYFARDGHYDGIKKDAELIASRILQGIPSVRLESVHDMSAIIRASKKADACVYACGFEPRNIPSLPKAYNGHTGRIEGCTNAWGFGIAYPNKAPDGIHWDVSIPAFQSHIQAQMPDILACLQ